MCYHELGAQAGTTMIHKKILTLSKFNSKINSIFYLKESVTLLYPMSFGSPKETHCLNLMKYHGASIEYIYCHQPPSTLTQSIGIYGSH